MTGFMAIQSGNKRLKWTLLQKMLNFKKKLMVSLDYLLSIQKAHDIFNIGLDSFIDVYMSRKMKKKHYFLHFSH